MKAHATHPRLPHKARRTNGTPCRKYNKHNWKNCKASRKNYKANRKNLVQN